MNDCKERRNTKRLLATTPAELSVLTATCSLRRMMANLLTDGQKKLMLKLPVFVSKLSTLPVNNPCKRHVTLNKETSLFLYCSVELVILLFE